ncbi:MAG: ADP-ribosylglycohydrolase family protein [Aureliella sp.]
MPSQEQFEGCLLGQALADAAGSRFEGIEREALRRQYQSPSEALNAACRGRMKYTDDTQMALALANYLVEYDEITPNVLMQRFVDFYEPWRGYGRGTRVLVDAFRDGVEYEFLAQTLFPGGSLGNGAAMRSAIVGLRFSPDQECVWEQSSKSAWPTHRNVLGIEGSQLISLAAMLAATESDITPTSLAVALHRQCKTAVFEKQLERLGKVASLADVEQFGNGIEANESVVTALACFAMHPDDYQSAVALAIWQGGDTDTIAAMTGALCGIRVERSGLPGEHLANLESAEFGDEVHALAVKLAESQQDR